MGVRWYAYEKASASWKKRIERVFPNNCARDPVIVIVAKIRKAKTLVE